MECSVGDLNPCRWLSPSIGPDPNHILLDTKGQHDWPGYTNRAYTHNSAGLTHKLCFSRRSLRRFYPRFERQLSEFGTRVTRPTEQDEVPFVVGVGHGGRIGVTEHTGRNDVVDVQYPVLTVRSTLPTHFVPVANGASRGTARYPIETRLSSLTSAPRLASANRSRHSSSYSLPSSVSEMCFRVSSSRLRPYSPWFRPLTSRVGMPYSSMYVRIVRGETPHRSAISACVCSRPWYISSSQSRSRYRAMELLSPGVI